MSWDVLLMTRLPSGDNGRPPPLGDAAAVRDAISCALPHVDWSDSGWGVLDGEGWNIEFAHSAEGLTEALMLHVHGKGDPVSAILHLCRKVGWVAFDTTEGEIIDVEAGRAFGWRKFQEYVQRTGEA